MEKNFRVLAVGSRDELAVDQFLTSCETTPVPGSWKERLPVSAASTATGFPRSRQFQNDALIVADRIGAIRAFCITSWIHHPMHRMILDIPVICIENGPNANEIARIFFDHLVALARETWCDVVRFQRAGPDA